MSKMHNTFGSKINNDTIVFLSCHSPPGFHFSTTCRSDCCRLFIFLATLDKAQTWHLAAMLIVVVFSILFFDAALKNTWACQLSTLHLVWLFSNIGQCPNAANAQYNVIHRLIVAFFFPPVCLQRFLTASTWFLLDFYFIIRRLLENGKHRHCLSREQQHHATVNDAQRKKPWSLSAPSNVAAHAITTANAATG